jgi:hypothetical protein
MHKNALSFFAYIALNSNNAHIRSKTKQSTAGELKRPRRGALPTEVKK